MFLDDPTLGRGPAGDVQIERRAPDPEEVLVLGEADALEFMIYVPLQDHRTQLRHLESRLLPQLSAGADSADSPSSTPPPG